MTANEKLDLEDRLFALAKATLIEPWDPELNMDVLHLLCAVIRHGVGEINGNERRRDERN